MLNSPSTGKRVRDARSTNWESPCLSKSKSLTLEWLFLLPKGFAKPERHTKDPNESAPAALRALPDTNAGLNLTTDLPYTFVDCLLAPR
jgi:hypothetical protein